VALEDELEQKLAQPVENSSIVTEETVQVNREDSQPDKETVQAHREDSQPDKEAVQANRKNGHADKEASQAEEETGQADKEFLELFQPASEADEDQPEWELEILPPIDLNQILDIINYLDDQPEVQQTELIPHMERPKITVFLNKPLAMINILRALPQVANVTEDTTGSNGSDVKPRRAKIELSRRAASKPSN
jgi:hypothetical protein